MTEQELREKIADTIDREDKKSFALPCMDIADQILSLIRKAGWMDFDMVKGLIFEVQAKKCAMCKVKGSS